MPRGYLKNSRGVARKVARGGGSNKGKSRNSLKKQNPSRKFRNSLVTLQHEESPCNVIEKNQVTATGTSVENLPQNEGICAICEENKQLIPLTKKCGKRHQCACYSCLRNMYIVQAQKSETNYPLKCFDPNCSITIRDTQIINCGLVTSSSELKDHYRMCVMAKGEAEKSQWTRTVHCSHCHHPRTFRNRKNNTWGRERIFSCWQCLKKFTVPCEYPVGSTKMSSFFRDGVLYYEAPETLGGGRDVLDILNTLTVVNPTNSTLTDCSICLCPLDGDHANPQDAHKPFEAKDGKYSVIKLNCSHVFHRGCIEYAFKYHKPVCPICRQPIREPRGFCPSASMSVGLLQDSVCPGFTNRDGKATEAIYINYDIPNGTQKSYHENPGRKYHGTYRTAYLPHNTEGHDLLARLLYAFTRGMNFAVGTSLTTGASNSVVWSSIHHKTSLSGGAHGFPDPGYTYNCHESLDALYIPDSAACRAAGAAQIIKVSLPQPPPKSRRQQHQHR